MQTQIELTGLQANVSIGIHDFELVAPQPYRLDIILGLNSCYRVRHDHINETVNYDALRERVLALLSSRHFNLQETVLQEVMALCLGLDVRVVWAEVRGAKTAVYPDCESVGLRYRATVAEWRLSRGATPGSCG